MARDARRDLSVAGLGLAENSTTTVVGAIVASDSRFAGRQGVSAGFRYQGDVRTPGVGVRPKPLSQHAFFRIRQRRLGRTMPKRCAEPWLRRRRRGIPTACPVRPVAVGPAVAFVLPRELGGGWEPAPKQRRMRVNPLRRIPRHMRRFARQQASIERSSSAPRGLPLILERAMPYGRASRRSRGFLHKRGVMSLNHLLECTAASTPETVGREKSRPPHGGHPQGCLRPG
jgi:hypothetical protein